MKTQKLYTLQLCRSMLSLCNEVPCCAALAAHRGAAPPPPGGGAPRPAPLGAWGRHPPVRALLWLDRQAMAAMHSALEAR